MPPVADLIEQIRHLLDAAAIMHAGTSDGDALVVARQRLDEPLRVAVAGRVKAGKSTLVNALLRDQLASTDVGECTRVLTWYRYGEVPRLVVHARDGSPRPVAFRVGERGVEPDLGSLRADDIEHMVLDWPTASLSTITLVDTPGIDSVHDEIASRSARALVPDDGTVGFADAVVYVMRHLHGADVRFLEAFAPGSRLWSSPLQCVGVLGRADEVGVARLDAMDVASRVASRYAADARIRRLCAGVMPVSGLLAQAAVALTEVDVAALRVLADADREAPGEATLDASTFVEGDVRRSGAPGIAGASDVAPEMRARLLDRMGLWGVRLAIDLLRTERAMSTSALADRLEAASGIDALRSTLHDLLGPRRRVLKARSALAVLDDVARRSRLPGSAELSTRVERLLDSSHELREAALLSDLRAMDLGFTTSELDDAERLLGGNGAGASERLGVDAWAPVAVRGAVAAEQLERWHRRSNDPFVSPAAAHAIRVLVRTGEGLVSALSVRSPFPPPVAE